ncbi:filamentous hemagglutinin N-terminal domain-containing protein, partial [Allocoleopsis sp.]|uniref:filamentous hemagglutinin N-terminal domain-containing protein n=1 Tax=Allocoleopsis sp. TaxID=3088169 RepID=UPI002FD5963C
MKLSPCLSKAFALNCLSISAIALFLLFPDHLLQAQIVPDNTLPVNSLVTSDANSFVINGGTSRGNNLFHSFAQFSLPTGSTALFNNIGDIQNIISRVTGGSISNIDGVIQANGTANLFFLNPKGIVFGSNASLNIGGSFLGSTATSINFADGTTFSATNPQSQSLLTVSIPVGLGFGSNPGAIRVQNTGHSLTVADPLVSPITGVSDSSTGLRVQAGKTLALVGGNVTLEGGILTAPEGRIELGSVGSGSVNISPTPQGFTFGYQGVQAFHNIQLSQRSLLDAS